MIHSKLKILTWIKQYEEYTKYFNILDFIDLKCVVPSALTGSQPYETTRPYTNIRVSNQKLQKKDTIFHISIFEFS